MNKVTSEQIAIAYTASKSYFLKNSKRTDAIRHMNAHGINPGYAGIFLQIFEHLKNGEVFSRTTSGESFDYFLGNIFEDFGKSQLEKSLHAFKKHIEYFEEKYKINRPFVLEPLQ